MYDGLTKLNDMPSALHRRACSSSTTINVYINTGIYMHTGSKNSSGMSPKALSAAWAASAATET